MKNWTAPAVKADGHEALLPVVGSTQWLEFARSPPGGAAAAGSAFGMDALMATPSPSGGGAPAVSRAPPGFSDQPFSTPPLMLPPPVPILVTYPKGPPHEPLGAR